MAVKKTILADVNPYLTRVALLEDDRLAEYYIELPGKEKLVGNIYKGVVENMLPGLEAAFVNIGIDRNAFLHFDDIALNSSDFHFNDATEQVAPDFRSKRIKVGSEVLVQVLKDPSGSKGARITMNITLPSRLIVLVPEMRYVGVSRRIMDEEERLRLRSMAEQIQPEGMGIIVRTAAQGANLEELQAEVERLVSFWKELRRKERYAKAPSELHRDYNLLNRTLRDLLDANVQRFVLNNTAAAREVYAYLENMPELARPEVEVMEDAWNLLDRFHVEGEVAKIFSRKVWLKCGGYIVIDHTEALTAIDVNSGRFVGDSGLQSTAFTANAEAAVEIARQIRLRDIGGMIIIDFIDMASQKNRDDLIDILETELKKDRTYTNVQGITQLGLLEMTRKKIRQKISAEVHMDCEYCSGTGMVKTPQVVAISVYSQYRMLKEHEASGQRFLLKAHPQVAAYMRGCGMAEEMADVTIEEVKDAHMESIRLTPLQG